MPSCGVPEIIPFRGLRYDASLDLARVVAPPYDVISDAERIALEDADPRNVVRLILPRDAGGTSKYTAGRALLDAWVGDGALRLDGEPSLTVYEMRAPLGEGTHVQRGILAAVALDDPAGVLPHERTYGEIVDDRLQLLRATACNLDPVFLVHHGADHQGADAIDAAAAAEPDARFETADGIEHRVWRLADPRAIEAVQRALEKVTVVIADGHHRWRTAQTYREERRATDGPGPWDHALAYLVDASRSGPVLLPIHRTLAGIKPEELMARTYKAIRSRKAPTADAARLAAELPSHQREGRTFAMTDGRRGWWLTVADRAAEREAMPTDRSDAWRALDVSVLHALVFERLLGGVQPGFVHSPGEAAAAIRRGDATVAILLQPMPFEAVRAVAEAGDPMPQKSTYFVPKPKTGIVLRSLR